MDNNSLRFNCLKNCNLAAAGLFTLIVMAQIVFGEFCPNLRNNSDIDVFLYRISSRSHLALPPSVF
ncbi:MAG: hypothetical protein PHC61_14355, partial [Chitinivibrionales bacterium]|nr:hypothetical protein [Chitinivibrionales bacterium]